MIQVEGTAVTKDEAWSLANHWVEAWNAHDLDLIMTHYDDAIELISPKRLARVDLPDAPRPRMTTRFITLRGTAMTYGHYDTGGGNGSDERRSLESGQSLG